MTKYWPLSEICNNPALHHSHKWEIMCAVYLPYAMSQGTLQAAVQIIQHAKPVESPLTVVHSAAGRMTRIYLKHPEFDAWSRLERGGFMAEGENCWFLLDNLH